jgi:murein DD-endopeptidase MepM/ murein hydrolase activator NlpD
LRPAPGKRWQHLVIGAVLAAVCLNPSLHPGRTDAWSSQDLPLASEVADLGEALEGLATFAPRPSENSLLSSAPAGWVQTGSIGASRGPDALKPQRYLVQPGDSLATIADHFAIDVPTMLGANAIDDPDLLPVGTELNVLPVVGLLYQVADGDTLGLIADNYAVDLPEIVRVNALPSAELIVAGDQLILPGARPRSVDSAHQVAPVLTIPAPVLSQPDFFWPAHGRITTYFRQVGWTSPRGHAGIDIAAPLGAPIAAAATGQVVLATRAGGPYGTMAIIDHGDGLRTVYGHLSELDVDVGERVDRGQLVGLCGSTGFSTGPHLHFEVRQEGELRDPLSYLP